MTHISAIPIMPLSLHCTALCERHGVPTAQAKILVDSLIDADMRQKGTHGLMRLPSYLQRVERGLMNAEAEPAIEHDTGPLLHINAHNAIGAVAASFAIMTIAERAERYGLALATVDRSNHLGAIGYWARALARRGNIGVIASDASPRLPATGGMEPVLGNNPWSIAIPHEDHPIVADLANSIVAAGKIRERHAAGQPLPEGWALDRQGRPTTDPSAALQGILLPMAGYKGYAITFMLTCLTNVLSMAESIEVRSLEDFNGPQGVSHLFLAIHPRTLYGDEAASFQMKTKQWVKRVKSSKRLAGNEEIFLPGEQAERNYARALQGGLILPQSTIEALDALALHCQLPPLATLFSQKL